MARRGKMSVRKRTPVGAPPGTLIADPRARMPTIRLISYGSDSMEELPESALKDVRERVGQDRVLWVDVNGLADIKLITELGALFGLHNLSLEDVLDLNHRPKVEQFDDHVFVVLTMLSRKEAVEREQVSLFVGKGFVLSFQERPGDSFDSVRERLARAKGRIRGEGGDYLAYALIDAAVDAYFPILEALGEEIEEIEEAVVAAPQPAHVERLHDIKRELLLVRRAIWPAREMLNVLVRDESPIISSRTRVYLRDTYDHAVQLMDILETYREIASGLVDVYMSSMSARLNDIMRVLTIIATIFIPLGFLASLWGMNFDPAASPWSMPELGWRFGYPMALAVMAAVALGLLWVFRRNRWL